jgi:outer membrane protein OmpA-like peptidoglycan-associated protein
MLTRIRETGTFYLLVACLAGCATRGQVRNDVAELDRDQQAGLERLESRLASLTEAIEQEGTRLEARRSEVAEASSQALLASDQARAAEAQAHGDLLGEAVFRVEGLRFEPGTAILTAEARTMLDQLVERLRAEDAGYYLEVQSRGRSGGGLESERAEAVRRYLHHDRGVPLHAVSTLAAASEVPPNESVLEIEPAPGEAALEVVVLRPVPRP